MSDSHTIGTTIAIKIPHGWAEGMTVGVKFERAVVLGGAVALTPIDANGETLDRYGWRSIGSRDFEARPREPQEEAIWALQLLRFWEGPSPAQLQQQEIAMRDVEARRARRRAERGEKGDE